MLAEVVHSIADFTNQVFSILTSHDIPFHVQPKYRVTNLQNFFLSLFGIKMKRINEIHITIILLNSFVSNEKSLGMGIPIAQNLGISQFNQKQSNFA